MAMNLRELFRRKESKYTVVQISRWLWRAWRGNQLQAIINALLGLLSVAVSLSQVWAVQHAIDVASHTIEGSLPWAVGIMGMLILCNFAISISSIWVKNILGIKAQNRMQQRMLDRILRSQWSGREKMHSGDVINRLEKDVGNVITFLTETIPSTISTLGLFLGAFFYLFSMDTTLPLIIVGLLPVFIFLSKFYMRRMRTLTRQVRDSDSRVQSVLQETIQNRMLIKTMESDSAMVDRLENTQSELRQNVVKRTAFSVFSNLILNFGFALVYLIAFHGFSAVVNLLKGVREKSSRTGSWKIDLFQGTGNLLIILVCFMFRQSTELLVCLYCGGLFYSAALRIFCAVRKNDIVYIQ